MIRYYKTSVTAPKDAQWLKDCFYKLASGRLYFLMGNTHWGPSDLTPWELLTWVDRHYVTELNADDTRRLIVKIQDNKQFIKDMMNSRPLRRVAP